MRMWLIPFFMIVFCSPVAWGSDVITKTRQFIELYNESYERDILWREVLERQLSPQDTPRSEVREIHHGDVLTRQARDIAFTMNEHWVASTARYNGYMKDLLDIYFTEPENRRAMQRIFDEIQNVFFNFATRDEHDRKTEEISEHLVEGAVIGGFLVPLVFSVRSIKRPPLSRSVLKQAVRLRRLGRKVVPQRARISRLRVGSRGASAGGRAGRSTQREPLQLKISQAYGRLISGSLWKGLVFGAAKNVGALAAASGAGAVGIGMPKFFLYQNGVWPIKTNPGWELDPHYRSAAILELDCKVRELSEDLAGKDLEDLPEDEALAYLNAVKPDLNRLADNLSFLQETAPLFQTSQRLSERIRWDEAEGRVYFEGESFTCPEMKGVRRVALPPIRQDMMTMVQTVEQMTYELTFERLDQQIRDGFQEHMPTMTDGTQGQEAEIPSPFSGERTVEEEIYESAFSLAYYQAIAVDPEWRDNIRRVFGETEDDVVEFVAAAAQMMLQNWNPDQFNRYLPELFNEYYESPDFRSVLTLLSFELSLKLEELRASELEANSELYIDPLNVLYILENQDPESEGLEIEGILKESEESSEESEEAS